MDAVWVREPHGQALDGNKKRLAAISFSTDGNGPITDCISDAFLFHA